MDTHDLPGERTVEESQLPEEKEVEMPKSRRSIMKKQVRASHEDHLASVSSQLKSDALDDSPTRRRNKAFPISIESRESKTSKPEMNCMTGSIEVNQLPAPQIECDDVDKTLERRRENTAGTALEGPYSALDRGGTFNFERHEGRRSSGYKPGGSSLRPPRELLAWVILLRWASPFKRPVRRRTLQAPTFTSTKATAPSTTTNNRLMTWISNSTRMTQSCPKNSPLPARTPT